MTDISVNETIVELLEFGRDNSGDYVKVRYANTNTPYKRYGDFSKRNNNPGNLVSSPFTRERGDLNPGNGSIPVVPDTLPSILRGPRDQAVDRFAIFPSVEKGKQAIFDLIFTSNNAGVGSPNWPNDGINIPDKYKVTDAVRSKPYKDRILLNALKAYAPYDGKGTDPIAYAQNVSKLLIAGGLTQQYIDSAPIGNYSITAKNVLGNAIVNQEGRGTARHVADAAQNTLAASTTDIAQYIRKVYLDALQTDDAEEYKDVIQAFAADAIRADANTSFNKFLEELSANFGTLENSKIFDGEITLVNGLNNLSAVSAGIEGAVTQRLQSIGNFTPSEQYFLLYKNYFEINPERMRNYMMVNADGGRDGRPYNLNYSHAWRAPAKLAVTANITIPGASGFRIGQIFWVGRTYETYKKFGAFQLFGLTETIDMSRGWTTELYARFNAMPLNKVKGLKSL